MPDIQQMIGKEVEAIANGITYRGVLVEVSDTEVYIRSTMQWMALPVNTVSVVRLAGQSRQEPERDGIIDGDGTF